MIVINIGKQVRIPPFGKADRSCYGKTHIVKTGYIIDCQELDLAVLFLANQLRDNVICRIKINGSDELSKK